MDLNTNDPVEPDTMTGARAGQPDFDRDNPRGNGPKYQVNVEGTLYPWGRSTVTAADIRQLAGISPEQPIEVIDLQTNVQRTLTEREVVELTPGLGFSKKIKFQRG